MGLGILTQTEKVHVCMGAKKEAAMADAKEERSKKNYQEMIMTWKRQFARKLDMFEGDYERAIRATHEEMYKAIDRMCFDFQVRVHHLNESKIQEKMKL